MKYYKIGAFVCHKLPSGELVIQSQNGIAKVNHTKLISLIEYLDENRIGKISHDDVEQYMSDYTDNAIGFLKKYGIIGVYRDSMNFNVKRIQLVSNDAKFEKNSIYLFEQLKQDSEIEVINNKKLEYEIYNQDLIVVFLNPYDKEMAEKIYNLVKVNSRCLLLMTYVYNSNLYIDNLYSPKWKNPCHYCHMGLIESQLRVSNNGSLSYQSLIDILYHEDKSFSVESSMTTVELFNFITLIINRLDNLVFRSNGHTLSYHESLEEINDVIMYDAKNKKVHTDTSIHWELCNCYE